MRFACLAVIATVAAAAQTIPNIRDALSCPNSPDGRQPYRVRALSSGDLRKIVINSPVAVCNDGTPAVMYVRSARQGASEPDGPSANRWIIHFLGGSSCSSFEECAAAGAGLASGKAP